MEMVEEKEKKKSTRITPPPHTQHHSISTTIVKLQLGINIPNNKAPGQCILKQTTTMVSISFPAKQRALEQERRKKEDKGCHGNHGNSTRVEQSRKTSKKVPAHAKGITNVQMGNMDCRTESTANAHAQASIHLDSKQTQQG